MREFPDYTTLGERPSPEILDHIRAALNEKWQRDHQLKNEAASPHVRDTLSVRLRRGETAIQWVAEL